MADKPPRRPFLERSPASVWEELLGGDSSAPSAPTPPSPSPATNGGGEEGYLLEGDELPDPAQELGVGRTDHDLLDGLVGEEEAAGDATLPSRRRWGRGS